MTRNPYLVNCSIYSGQLRSLHYPSFVNDLVYREYDEIPRSESELEIWQHPEMHIGRRISGHDIHRYILEHNLFERTISFHHLRLYEVYPKTIPVSFYSFSHILGWKGLAIDKNGDWWVPALYMKGKSPTVHWILLSLASNAGEATALECQV